MKTWKDNLGNLKIEFEVSTQCNAYCPQCMRYESGVEKMHPNTTNKKWSCDDFKEAFDSDTLSLISHFHFSGTRGDPCTCKDLPEIVDYITKTNSKISIKVSTNGSLQNEDFWWNLGVAGGEGLVVEFAVDGCDQEMHAKYRRNTDLEKILNNIEILSSTKATATIFTVVFKHNQDYVDDIFSMARSRGAAYHDVVESNRFDNGKRFDFIDKSGNEDFLEQADIKIENEFRLVKDHRNKINRNASITCKWNEWKKLLILEDGRVYPCCYLSWPIEMSTRIFTGKASYLNNAESILDKSLGEILNNDFFSRELFNSFSEAPDRSCLKYCGK